MSKKSVIAHSITRPLFLIAPGLVALLGLGIYGFPSISWRVLCAEMLAILIVSNRLKFNLAAALCLVLFALLFFLGSSGTLSTPQLVLFLIPTLVYHIVVLKNTNSPQGLTFSLKDGAFILATLVVCPLVFYFLETYLILKPMLFFALYLGFSIFWKLVIMHLGLGVKRLPGDVASECMLFTLSLGLGPLCFITSFGVYIYESFLWWPAFGALLFCLRLKIPKSF